MKTMQLWITAMLGYLLITSGCSNGRAETDGLLLKSTPTLAAATEPTANQTTAKATKDTTQTVTPMPAVQEAELEALYQEGSTLFNQYKHSQAIQVFDKALQKDPKFYKALCGKGAALSFLGKYEESLAMIDQGLLIRPDYGYGHYAKALSLKLQKKYQPAIESFEKAILIDNSDTWSLYGISTVYGDLNNPQKSIEYLKKAFAIEPSVKDLAKRQSHFDQIRNSPEYIAFMKNQ